MEKKRLVIDGNRWWEWKTKKSKLKCNREINEE